ncbi:hypothetical protein Lalb_Chr07g0188641 [Lupinus albus]|uniref:Uncharacterized protein n=1 Tax=Lupinus albus TaxID=3870 RepID=A0A6A4QAN2_LUPAL|nr:hypothetical protein Lalb_Chr07g0188641 [Lupinus albus]
MGSEEQRDPFKRVDWKVVGGEIQQNLSVQPTFKKKLPKKVRQILDCYFLLQCMYCWNSSGGLD